MPLSSGHRVGPYEIVAQLGAGGMGEVYRAKDSKLKRDVAIKVLPAEVANDRERLARFQREAEVLAALNHPNIAHVHGLEDGALVMELVEGEDLAERLKRGPIPLDEALANAKQLADALEAAHEQGIVHRDLKPANVKVRPDGTVKVLDFGLAKGLEPAGAAAASNVSLSPTMTSPVAMTIRGVILGTAAYMAPEQAKGKPVDTRADIWAFGCVLYEMITARRAFKGEDVTDIITSVMRDAPDWSALPPETPLSVRRLLKRCLEKDTRKRAAHISIARLELDDAMAATGEPVADALATLPRRVWPLAIGVGLAMAVAASAVTLILAPRETTTTLAPVLRYSLPLPTRTPISSSAVSPDGQFVLIAGRDDSGNRRLWLRPLDGAEFAPLASEGADFPFWSPDSKDVAFFAGRKLFRVNIGGGAPQQIADIEAVLGRTNALGTYATWGDDGTILFGAADGIYRVSASGGPIERVTAAVAPEGVTPWSNFRWPQWLPGQRGLLFSTRSAGFAITNNTGALIYQPLNGTAVQLTSARSRALVTSHGVLVGREDAGSDMADLRLHQFSAATATLDEPGVVLAAGASLNFSASSAGVLVYQPGSPGAPGRFEWVDQAGHGAGDAFDAIGIGPFSLSKDESLLAFGENGIIKVRDLARGVTSTLREGGVESVFSPDGRRIAYSLLTDGRPRIVAQSSSGGPVEVVYESDRMTIVEDWSSDGKYLAANEAARRGLIIPLDKQQPPIVYAELPSGSGPAAVDESRFSPDGRWLLYNAAENGRHEVFLIPLPPTGERWQVSLVGGSQGRWRRDGRAMFYLASDGALMMVDVNLVAGGRPALGRPRKLFETGLTPTTNMDQYAPNADGTKFLLRRPRGNDSVDRLEVIANWPTLVTAGTQR